MNNVWTAIAFRAPCASRQARPGPLLELFNGYSRYHTSPRLLTPRVKDGLSGSCRQAPFPRDSSQSLKAAVNLRSGFTTSSWLSARNRKVAKIERPLPPSPSKLEPAPTVAYHTEGVADNDGNLTWRDYDPEGGMPLPGGERPQPQINSIFGSEEIDADKGNYILNVVYWRRMSGALIDVGLTFPKDSGVTQEKAMQGLEYVRSLNPGFDEQMAGQVWADEEALRLQNELQERAVRLRLYKPTAAEQEEFEEEEEPEEEQGTAVGRERNRESQLQRTREENEAKYEAEQARKAEAEAKAELAAIHTHRGPLELAGGVQPSVELVTYTGRDGIAISRPQTKAWLLPVERKPWVKYYEQQAEILKNNTVPQLSLVRRLGPSLLVLLLVFGAGIYLTENYTPPPDSARIWPNVRPAVATLTALSGAMAAFFILSRLPPFWKTLNKYFTLVPVYPYASSLIGSCFRHDFSHLLINMTSLWVFGLILHDDIGRGAFLSVFFAAGALGAYSSLTYHVLTKAWGTYIFGSSGCVLGVVAAATTLRPNSHIKVFGQEIPVAVWLWLTVWAVAEVIAMRRFKGSIDHMGHLGGLLGGFGAGMWLRQNRQKLKGGTNDVGSDHVMKPLS